MKIFCTDYALLRVATNACSPNEPNDVISDAAISGGAIMKSPSESDLYMKPDSSLLNSGKFLYLPKHLTHLNVAPQLIVRVAKVGRAVQPQFAHRYFSEAALGLSFFAPKEWQECYNNRLDTSLTTGFDGALMRSEFAPLTELHNQELIMQLSDQRYLLTPTDQQIIIDTIVMLSKYYLLKMGDLVCFALQESYRPIDMDQDVTISQNGEVTLYTGIR